MTKVSVAISRKVCYDNNAVKIEYDFILYFYGCIIPFWEKCKFL